MSPDGQARSSKHRRTTSRSRSRSPYRSSRHTSHRERSRERHRHGSHSHSHSHSHSKPKRSRSTTPKRKPAASVALPFNARALSKQDFAAYKPTFALYLDIQKHLLLEELDEREARGRWKSFVGKWNRGELAEGWYDPATKQRADANAEPEPSTATNPPRRASPDYDREASDNKHDAGSDSDSSDSDDIGPALPSGDIALRRSGPAIPRHQDLELRDELAAEDWAAAREDAWYERKQERKLQKERLEELAPRADPGSRERQLEKRREKTATLNAFRDAKEADTEEVGESDLLGDEGGVEGFKAKKKEMERKKNEREIRKEEMLRARAAEREERLQVHREKEQKTMEMLKALAKQRFG